MSSRVLLPLALCLLAPLALTGCGSSSLSGGADSHHSAAPDPNAGVPKGAALKGMLLPVSVLHSGYRADADLTRDTGDVFSPPSVAPVGTDCKKLDTTGWIDATNVGAAAFAQADFQDAYQQEFNEEIDAFRGTDASTVMARIKQLASQCATFHDKTGTVPAINTVTSKPVPGLGDESVEYVVSSPTYKGGHTVVVTRVGKEVVASFYNVQAKDKGADALGFAKKLVANVRAKPAG